MTTNKKKRPVKSAPVRSDADRAKAPLDDKELDEVSGGTSATAKVAKNWGLVVGTLAVKGPGESSSN
jgi:hypothetical protein